MKFWYPIFCFVLFACFSNKSFSQPQSKIDSLTTALDFDIEDTVKVGILNRLFDHSKIAIPEKALGYAQDALILAERISDLNGKALAINNLGVYYLYKSEFKEALNFFNKALEIREKINDKEGITESYNNIGSVYDNYGEYEKALDYQTKALQINIELENERGIAITYAHLGIIYDHQGKYELALQNYMYALSKLEELNYTAVLGGMYNNVGEVYRSTQKYDLALEYYAKSLLIKQDLKDKKGVAMTLNNKAIVYYYQDNIDKSLDMFKESLKIREELDDKKGMAQSYNNIGELLSEKNELKQSIIYLTKALQIHEEIGDKLTMISTLMGLGNLYEKMEESQVALDYYNKSNEIAKEIGALTELKSSYKHLSSFYETISHYAKAYKYHKLHSALKDSIFNEESMKSMNDMQAKYESEKKEEELAILEAKNKINDEEIENKKYQQYGLTGGIILVLAFLGLFINRFREKNKTNKLLGETNHKLEEKKNSLEEKKTELQNLSLVANETFNSVVIADGKGKMEWANFSFSRLTGYTLDKFTEKFGENLIENSSEENLSERIEEARKTRRSVKYESKLKRKTGEELWTQTTLSPILDEQDNIKHLIAIDTNITELKETLSKIQEKDKDITDSINYASRIQSSVKVSIEEIKKIFPKCFIINNQSDTVGGLTHYYYKSVHLHYLGIIDCKIEGVPGAFLAMLTTDLVNNIISTSENIGPKEIISELMKEFSKIKRSNADEDLGFEKIELKICCIDENEKKISYSDSEKVNGQEKLPLIMSNCDLKLNGSTNNQSLEQLQDEITNNIKTEKNVLVFGIEI